MNYEIHKSTYAEGLAYRYRITDEAGTTQYEAEPTGLSLPTPSRLTAFTDADSNPIGRLEPSSSSIWSWVKEFSLLLGEDEEPRARIQEKWSLVDRILLRLPCYKIWVGERFYVARGTRHGELFYEIFFPPVEPKVEEPEEEEITLEEPQAQEDEEEEKAVELTVEEIPERLEEGERFRWGEKVGEIRRPSAGASYIIEVEEASLRQAPLPLAALAILADLHMQER
jgi:hypothetical protein